MIKEGKLMKRKMVTGLLVTVMSLSTLTVNADPELETPVEEPIIEESGFSVEEHMGTVYVSTSVTDVNLGFQYNATWGDDSEYHYWYVTAVYQNSVEFYAVVRCDYEDNLITDYDACQVTGAPPTGICCYALVRDGVNATGYTDLAYGSMSSKAYKVHTTDYITSYRTVFGQWIP